MKIGRTLRQEYPLLILLLLLLSLPAAYGGYNTPTHISKMKLTIAFMQSLAFALPLTLLAARFRKAMKCIIISLVSLFFIADVFCIFSIGSRINPLAVSLFLQTNASEAEGFLSQTRQINAIAYSALSLACIMLIYTTLTIIKRRHHAMRISPRKDSIIGITAIVLFAISCVTIYLSTATSRLPITPEEFGNNTAIQLTKSVARVINSRPDINRLVASNNGITIDSIDTPRPDIVYVIGESYNRNHSALYGYPHPTTPNMSDAANKGNLIVFSNIVCRHQTTKAMMKELLSTSPKSSDDAETWSSSPLLPAVMKKAGYNVMLFDNQTSQTLSETFNEFSAAYFYTNSRTSEQCFDYINQAIFPYDGDMVEHSTKIINEQPADKPLFVIYHLNGQHVPASKNYPAHFSKFTAEDYPEKNFLSNDEKCVLAHYDNATLYNDHVIGMIHELFNNRPAIIIYTSDHGEEIYDFRNQYGRTDHPITPDIAKCIFEVPMVMWLTDKYISNFTDGKAEYIRDSASRKGINGQIPHTILELAGIHTSSFNPKASIINTRYIAPKRILRGSCDYDSLMRR